MNNKEILQGNNERLTLNNVLLNNILNTINSLPEAGGGSVVDDLPEGYTRLRYIRSTDVQYIDTGVIPTNNTGFDIDYTVYDQLSSNDRTAGALFGARRTYTTDAFVLTTYSGTPYPKGHFLYGTNNNVDYIRNNAGITRAKREQMSFRNGVLTMPDGTTKTLNPYVEINCPSSICIFALNENGTKAEYSTTKLYRFKLYEGTSMIRDFVPAFSSSDGVCGLYEKITNTFYPGVTNGTPFEFEEL